MLAQVVRELDLGSEANNWAVVAKRVEGRTAKQCRERWFNHLDPTIKRGAFTAHEDELLIFQQGKIGNRWSLISAMLPGRTEDAVKSRWKTLQRNGVKLKASSQSSSPSGGRASSHTSRESSARAGAGSSGAGPSGVERTAEQLGAGGGGGTSGSGDGAGLLWSSSSSAASLSSQASVSSAEASSSTDAQQVVSIPVIPPSPQRDESKPFFVQRVENRFRKTLVRQWPSFVRRVQNRFRKTLVRSWDMANTNNGPREDVQQQNFKLFF